MSMKIGKSGKQEREGRPVGKAGGLSEKPPFFTGWERAEPEESGPGEAGGGKRPSPVESSRSLKTKKGEIVVTNYYRPEELERLRVDDGISMFSRHNPERQKKALLNVANSVGGNVIVGVKGDLLVSYIGIHHPSERERWGKQAHLWLYELGAIEVSKNYRRIGLAEQMLDIAFADPFYDDKIVLTTGFTWHWDLEGTGMTKLEYKALGVELFGRYGFMEMTTDEPNVTMDSANLFLVRLGKDSSFSQYQKFASLLFANEWESMLRGF